MPVLLLVTGPSAGNRFQLEGELTLGRSPSCEVPLEDHRVSRRHAKLEWVDGQARVEDLGSRNGTLVNGERIEVPVVLLPGDRVQVGDTTVLYEPSSRASVTDSGGAGASSVPLEDLLAVVGGGDAALRAAVALAGAGSEVQALRRAAEWLRSAAGGRVAVLVGEPGELSTLVVAGGSSEGVEIPRELLKAALERREVVRAGGDLVAPLAAGEGAPWGVIFLRRGDPQEDREARLAAVAARLAGEQCAALRAAATPVPARAPVGTARPFRVCLDKLRRVAPGSASVVIHGEPGTGRRLLARHLHAHGDRPRGPFVVVDCAASAVELELFGAPSGEGLPARRSAPMRADGGTLVLAGVEALPRALAERVVRLLQRLGGVARQERVDIRLVATARAALETLVAEGGLDAELAGSLAGSQVQVPPLRERTGDVPALLAAFSEGRILNLSPDALRMLAAYPWPGNVRELEILADRLGLLYAEREVTALMLPPEFQGGAPPGGQRSSEPGGGDGQTLAERISRLERDAISEALREAGGKKILAAQILGISRPTLDKKIADYSLVVEKGRSR